MTRNGNYDIAPTSIEIDKLNYTYDSYNQNRLIKVTDLTNSPLGFSDGANYPIEYDYDGHGNMIRDDNKGITSILYNHLNLPTQITFSGTTTRKIQYLYNAIGAKQKKVVTNGTVITTTAYLSGFQYQNNVLEFFPHAEGYVKYTEGFFNYVFNYTDHLGNVRLSYAQDPNGFATKVLEENHYYPFGLKHTNYDNGTQRFMRAIGEGDDDIPIFIAPDIFGSSAFKYKFQGQERQDELGLNWDSFKWRNYDYAIGRFMSIDPLSENYARWSPYTFSGNIVINARELEGLEPGVLFGSMEDAADNWGQQYNAESINLNQEYGSTIYQISHRNGTIRYSYSDPNVGTDGSSVVVSRAPVGTVRKADIHSHAAYNPEYLNNMFSGIPETGPNRLSKLGDIGDNNRTGLIGFVTTPNGSLQKYDPAIGIIRTLSTTLPSDKNDPERLNNIPTSRPLIPFIPVIPAPFSPSKSNPPVAPIPVVPRNSLPPGPLPPVNPLPLPKFPIKT